jgi:ferric-dicitrate binding protein FerR (iron transport regulator)
VVAGHALVSGEQVKTEADGLAMVKFLSDGSMMKLKPRTHLTFAARESKGVLMSLGAALFDIKPSNDKDKFTVTTPTGVAKVKGTRFWVTSASDSSGSVVVLDGVVNVKSSADGKARNVRQGYTALLGREGLDVREARGADLPEQSQRLEFEFRDSQGNTRTLRIDGTQEQ